MKSPDRDAWSREATPAELAALKRRIALAAGPTLLRRRHRAMAASEYIATWAHSLLPIAFVATFAGAVALIVRPARVVEVPTADEAILNAATNDVSTPQLVDIVLRASDDETR